MLDDAEDLTILQGVIGLAKAFGRGVIAEGVEHEAQASVLRAAGCRVVETGALLELSVDAVKKLLGRGRVRLRKAAAS